MESTYSCLIVDDEYPAHDVIKALISLNPQLEFTKSCYNGEDALLEINSSTYDIIFLDINMPIFNGLDVLQKLEEKPAIIVTTAYTNFAFDAYQNDAIDYLQKPISAERFRKAIDKAITYAYKRKLEATQFLIFKVDGFNQKINQTEIIYCQSLGNFTRFFINNIPKPILVNQSFTNQLKCLNPELFIQIHRTCIVNKLYIARKKENLLILKNDVELPIGRKFMPKIQALLI
jgi:two-component system, LytTR family, response regulator